MQTESHKPSQREILKGMPKKHFEEQKERFGNFADVAVGRAIPVKKERSQPVEFELTDAGDLVPSDEPAFGEKEFTEEPGEAIEEAKPLLVDEEGIAELEHEFGMTSLEAKRQEAAKTAIGIKEMEARIAMASGEDKEIRRQELAKLKNRFSRLQDMAKLDEEQRKLVVRSGVIPKIVDLHTHEVATHKGGTEAVFTPRDVFVPVLTDEVARRESALQSMGLIAQLRAPGRAARNEKNTFQKLLNAASKSVQRMESK